ncbi:MAG: single-stranded DNA-binding protein, partial [Bacteroidales bacterium]|nr:single-stranded DNA-binding protein [Bacteroidales bacterium]
GKLRTRSWTDQGGQKHYTTEVIVDSLQLLGKKSDNPAAAAQPASQQQAQAYQQPAQSSQQPAQSYQRPAPEQRPVQAAQVADVDEVPTDDLPF